MTFRNFCMLLVVCISTPWRVVAEPVVVFAAASLKGPLDEIFAQSPDLEVVISYGGSGSMAQQILRGAPADIYISANAAWADWVETRHDAIRLDVLGNTLVLIQPEGGAAVLSDVSDLDQTEGAIAMGQRDSVPAGIYAREAFAALEIWPLIARRAVEVPSVTAALRLVALGEVPFGVVYGTDVQASDEVEILASFPADLHTPIVYPMLLLETKGRMVFDHLTGPTAQTVFEDHGFDWLGLR